MDTQLSQAIESSFPLKMEHYRHGEAVALGMLCVSFIGEKYFNVKNLFKDHINILKNFNYLRKFINLIIKKSDVKHNFK